MAWNRNEPDPFEARKRQLAEQERLLSEQRRRLTEQLRPAGEAASAQAKRAEPLVWRNEEDSLPTRVAEPTPARKRNLARQTRRDMIVVLVLVVLLVIVLGLVLWVAHAHVVSVGLGRKALEMESSQVVEWKFPHQAQLTA